MTTINYSLKEARQLANELFERTDIDYKYIVGRMVPGVALDTIVEKIFSLLNEEGINDNTPAGDEIR